MRTLTQSSGQRPRIVEKLVQNWKPISFLSELVCIIYLGALMLPEYNERTRISENALLPALVQENFAYTERIATFMKELPKQSDVADYVKEQLDAFGVESDIQAFEVDIPGYNVSARNVYAVVRSGRSPSVESILVAVSLANGQESPTEDQRSPGSDQTSSIKDYGAIAVTLALATHSREQVYWARDIVFVFASEGTVGMRAFLNAYHDRQHSKIHADSLSTHSGSIVGAFVPKTTGSTFTRMNLEFNMVNGGLPNLDLINLMVRLANKFALVPTIYDHVDEREITWPSIAKVAVKGALTQAFSSEQGLHSAFALYAIQGVTVHVNGGDEWDDGISLTDFTRICEGALRSLNNILERLHQSYFLYILPNPRRFISVAYYMPSIGILLLPMVILILREWFAMPKFAPSNSFLIYHVIGLAAYFISLANFSDALLAMSMLVCPYYLLDPMEIKCKTTHRFLFYVEFSLVFGALSLINFSLSLVLLLLATPLALILTTNSLESRPSKFALTDVAMVIVLVVVLVFCRGFVQGWEEKDFSENIPEIFESIQKSHLLFDGFLYPLGYVVLMPLWNVMMQIAIS